MTEKRDPYKRLFKVAKWNRLIPVTDDHRLFARLPEFAGWTKAKHEQVARDYFNISRIEEGMYGELISLGLRLFGDGNGVLISGVYREHWPELFKADLRQLAHSYREYSSRSLVHWRAAGKRRETWIGLPE